MSAPEAATATSRFTHTLRGWIHSCWPEGSRVLALFFSAFLIGVIYVSTWGGPPEFWQQIFGPSVMVACGEGFNNPHLDDVPGLEDFLYLRADSFDCGNIPEDARFLPEDHGDLSYDEVQAFHPEPQFPGWTQWQRFHRYLLMSVALSFYLFGVAWQSLTPLYGLLYGLTNALGYGIFRLGMGRWTATLFSILLMTSPVHLQQLPQLRDYSKAPFFFLILLVLGWLLKRPLPLKIQLPLAALAGFFGGLGLGFRQDVSFAIMVFCVLVACLSPGHLKQTWWRRALILAVFVGAVAILATPILRVLAGVNNSTHDTIIGFTAYCDQRLGVSAPSYDFGDPFLDEYVRGILMDHAHRTTGRTEVFRHYSAEYDQAGKAYFREMVHTFPADMIIRGYASVLRIVDELQISSANGAPRGITNQFIVRLYQWRQALINGIPGGGRYYVAAMLLVLGAVNPRLALALFLGMMVLAGYPALRFSERHAFHMEILTLFAMGFLLHGAYRACTTLWRDRQGSPWKTGLQAAMGYLKRGTLVAAAMVALLLLPLYSARAWQSRQVPALLTAYDTAERTLLRTERRELDDGSTLVALPSLTDVSDRQPTLPMYCDVLVLEFEPAPEAIPVDFVFEADHPNFLFNRTMTVPAKVDGEAGNTRIFYPAYHGDDARIQGFRLNEAGLGQLRGVYQLVQSPQQDILLNAVLTPSWKQGPFYQSLSR